MCGKLDIRAAGEGVAVPDGHAGRRLERIAAALRVPLAALSGLSEPAADRDDANELLGLFHVLGDRDRLLVIEFARLLVRRPADDGG